jgi:hypothetical protein
MTIAEKPTVLTLHEASEFLKVSERTRWQTVSVFDFQA